MLRGRGTSSGPYAPPQKCLCSSAHSFPGPPGGPGKAPFRLGFTRYSHYSAGAQDAGPPAPHPRPEVPAGGLGGASGPAGSEENPTFSQYVTFPNCLYVSCLLAKCDESNRKHCKYLERASSPTQFLKETGTNLETACSPNGVNLCILS